MKQEKVTIDGVEYTLQKVLPRAFLRMRQQWKNRHGQPIEEKMYDDILEHVVVSPKVKLDDFEDMAVVEELVTAAITFQLGDIE